jgi:hypothetical protein
MDLWHGKFAGAARCWRRSQDPNPRDVKTAKNTENKFRNNEFSLLIF